MPSSIDVPMMPIADHDAPMAFRRERYWFLSFLMAPFQDIDSRASELAMPRSADQRRGR